MHSRSSKREWRASGTGQRVATTGVPRIDAEAKRERVELASMAIVDSVKDAFVVVAVAEMVGTSVRDDNSMWPVSLPRVVWTVACHGNRTCSAAAQLIARASLSRARGYREDASIRLSTVLNGCHTARIQRPCASRGQPVQEIRQLGQAETFRCCPNAAG
eukprot:355489-Chlamydomonas_euryale.AAC.11